MKSTKKYQGIVVPAVTPLTSQHRLDTEAVEKMFANFYEHDGMPFILGTTGESASLPNALKNEYVKLAGKLKLSGTTLYAGIGSNCLEESISLANHCFDLGIDVLAAALPSYYSLNAEQVKRYYLDLADAISGPMIIYNIPATTHMSIPVRIIDELSYHPNIVGVKDSERSDKRLDESLALWSGREDFSHFLGWAAKSAYALLNGGDGLIPSTANYAPSIYKKMLQAADAGDSEALFHCQLLSDQLGNVYQAGRSLGESLWALKVLMSGENLCQPYVMPPLRELGDDEVAKLNESLRVVQQQYDLTSNTKIHV